MYVFLSFYSLQQRPFRIGPLKKKKKNNFELVKLCKSTSPILSFSHMHTDARISTRSKYFGKSSANYCLILCDEKCSLKQEFIKKAELFVCNVMIEEGFKFTFLKLHRCSACGIALPHFPLICNSTIY